MARKNNRTVNKIDNLNVEIDYEKLANAIVEAEKKANEVKCYTTNTFAVIIGLLFRFFAGMGICFSAYGAIYGIAYLIRLDWKNVAIIDTIIVAIIIAMILTIIFLLSILLFKSAKEIEYEKDRQFVVSVFSAIISFMALVVALIALNK